MSDEVATREAATPTELTQKSWGYSFSLTLAAMVGGASIGFKQLLIPIQVSILAPTNTNTAFTLVSSVGAFVGLLAALVVGALSDRTTLRWGRRRSWMVFGIITAGAGMAILAPATTIPMVLFGESLAQVGVDTLLGAVTAIIPDQVPMRQRFLLTACVGMAPNVGGVLVLVLITHFTNTRIVAQGYHLIAVVSCLCVVCFLLFLREQPLAHEGLPPFHVGRFFLSFLHPLRSRDFTLTLISRSLAYFSFATLGAYTLFYLRAVLHFAIPFDAQGVMTFQLILTTTLLVVALFTGWLSGRVNRLKAFVIAGAIMMALGAFVIALVPTWHAMLIASIIFGAGLGSYLGVDLNIAVQVLPSDSARGKDLSLMYTAIFVPVILSTLIGGTILNLSHNNFALLFAIVAGSSILAAGLIMPIKSVR